MASLTFRTSRSRRECVKPVVLVVLPVILAILSQLTGAGVAAGTRYLNSFAIQVQEVYADHLLIKATGSVDVFNNAFGLGIHDFSKGGKPFHRPIQSAVIPASLSEALLVLAGPSDEYGFARKTPRRS